KSLALSSLPFGKVNQPKFAPINFPSIPPPNLYDQKAPTRNTTGFICGATHSPGNLQLYGPFSVSRYSGVGVLIRPHVGTCIYLSLSLRLGSPAHHRFRNHFRP